MNLEKLYYYRKQEKHYTAKILEQLLSVWKSKSYLQMGYSTIYKFLVQHLHYSEHEANARIAALQLMKRSVVAAKEVSEGKISPSSARVIEQHLKEKEKTTKLTKENVAAIVQSVSTLSMRKTDQKLQLMLQTKARKTQVLYIHENLQLKLDRVKRQYDVDLSNSELIEILLEEKLKSPTLKKQAENRNLKMDKKQCEKKLLKNSRYISRKVKQAVWLRSQGECEHPSCKEKRNLEYDHIFPYSKKGSNSLENIQLLCRAHNQWKGDSLTSLI